jgi:hypothetical protein
MYLRFKHELRTCAASCFQYDPAKRRGSLSTIWTSPTLETADPSGGELSGALPASRATTVSR